MKKIYFLFVALFLSSNALFAQIPVAYWSFEDATHTSAINAVTDQISTASGSSFAATGISLSTAAGAGTAATTTPAHLGPVNGFSLRSNGDMTTATTDPTTSATTYWQFSLSTTGVSGLTLRFDQFVNNASNSPFYGVLYSTNGTTWNFVASSTTPGANTFPFSAGNWGTASIALPAACNNVSTLYLRLYGYRRSGSGDLRIDNLTVFANTTTAGAVFTTANETNIYNMVHSGASGITARNNFNATGASTNVSINTTSGIAMASGQTFSVTSTATVTFGSTGAVSGAGIFNIASGSSLVTSNTGGIVSSITTTGTDVYTAGANYRFNAATTTPFPAGTFGNPANLTINPGAGSSVTLNLSPTITGVLSFVAGNLAIGANTLTLNGTVSGMSGTNLMTGSASSNLTIGGTGALGTLFFNQGTDGTTNNIATFTMNRTTSGTVTLGNKLVSGTALTLTNGQLLMNNQPLTLNGTFTGSSANNLVGSASSTLTIGGSGTLGTLFFSQATPGVSNMVAAFTLNRASSGLATLGSAMNVGGGALNLTTGTLADGGNTITLTGNITGTGTHTGSGKIMMVLSGATISGATLANLELNNAGGFSLSGSPTVNGFLIITAGKLTLGTNNLNLGTTASISFTPTLYIIATSTGQVRKMMAANGSFFYPVGDATNYTPIVLNFTSGTYAGGAYAGVNLRNVKHPNNANTTNYINRYWSVATSGITSPSYIADPWYVAGDVAGTETSISGGKYAGSLPWVKYSAVNALSHTFTTAAVTNTSADITGISTAAPTVTPSASTSVCAGSGTSLSITSSTGDPVLTYSWAPSTGLSATTGTPVTATPGGTTTYTVTVTDGNGFTNTATTTVTVNPLPATVTASGGGTFCGSTTITAANGGDGTIYFQGTTSGGTSTATPSTSEVVTSSGTYYFRARSAAGCWGTEGSVTVTINPLPAAVTASGGGAYCVSTTVTASNGGDGTIYFQGTTSGGTSTATPSTSEVITTSGTYYFRARSAAGCWGTEGSVTVTINPLPATVTASGGGTFCGSTTVTASNGGDGTIYFQGTTSGGTSTATPSASEVVTSSGTYYFRARSAAGCWGTEGSVTVTINPLPATVTAAGGGAFCASTTITASNGGDGTIYFQGTTSGGTSTATPSTSEVITSSGTYYFRAQSSAGCWGTQGSVTVTINPLPATVTASGGGAFCASATITASNGGDGTIYFQGTTSGGTSTATPSTSEIITSSGTYYFRAQSAAGCWGTQGSVTVTINPLPATVTASGGGAFCSSTTITASNGGDGTIYFQGTTSGGTSAATPSTSEIILTSGTYYFRAQSAAGCWGAQGSVTVTINPLPATVTASGAGAFCNSTTITASNGGDGTIYFQGTTSGGTSTATPSTSEIITSSGTYYFRAQSAASCWGTQGSVTVTINPLPATVTASGGGAFCNSTTITASNGGDGTIYFQGTTSGGTSTATPSTSEIITSSGTYYFRAQSAAGCWGTEGSVTVTINPLPATVTASGGGTFCNSTTVTASNGGDGTIYFQGTTSGGTSTATPSTSEIITTSGTYYFRAQSAAGCWGTQGSVTVTINPLPAAVTASGGGAYCVNTTVTASNGGDGTIYFQGTTSGGTSTATPSTSEIITSSGTYYFRAQSAAGCWGTEGSVTVTINPLPATVTASGGGTFCNSTTITASNGGDGTIYFQGTTSGGTSTATPSTSEIITSSGTYYFRAQSAAGCWGTQGSVTVTINPLPAAYSVTGGGSYCVGGIAVGLSGSETGVNYQLYVGSSTTGSPVAGTGAAISFGSQSSAGTYTVRATNPTTTCTNGMSGSTVVTISPSPLAYTVTGGGIACSADPGVAVGLSNSQSGVSYQLYNGATAVGSLVAGTGAAVSFGLQTVSGTYSVVANPGTSCQTDMSGTASVTINPSPTQYNVTGGGSYCSGGTGVHVGLDWSVVGVNYQLYNGTSPVGSPVAGAGSGLDFGFQTAAGTYTVRATNASNFCVNGMLGSATITANALPTAYTLTGGGTYCDGGSGMPVGVSNSQSGINYQLYNGASTVGSPVAGTGAAISFGSQTATGTYSVLATDATTSCTNAMASTVAVSVNAAPASFTVTGGGGYCTGGTGPSIGLSGSASGFSYQLYNGAAAIGSPVSGTGSSVTFGTYTAAGTYTVLATNNTTFCTAAMAGSATVVINPLPVVYTVTGGGTYCAGGSGVAVGLSNSESGVNYQLYNGGSATGSPVAGTGAAISFGSQTATGTYTVLATNATTSCPNNMGASAVVSINPVPTAFAVTGGGPYCSGSAGSTVGLSGSEAGINYQLYNGATALGSVVAGTGAAISFAPQTSPGTYSVLATNTSTSCTNGMSGTVNISINSLPNVFSVTGGGSYCAGGSGVAIGVSGSNTGINYQLYNGASVVGSPVAGTGAAISFGSQTTAGTYTVLATDASTSCTNAMSGSSTIIVNPLPTAYAVTGGGSYCAGGSGVSIGLSASTSGINYQLYNGASTVGSPVAGTGVAISFGVHTASGTYTVLATNSINSCTAPMSGSATVVINPLPTAYTVTGGGSYCAGGAGVAVGLDNSESGVNYQLYNGPTATGSPVAGTGSAISFGSQTAAGTYTVFATNATTSCTNNMAGSATITILPAPTAYTVTGGGSYCSGGSGVAIGLGNSATGFTYQLYNGASTAGSPVAGTGAAISFGSFTAAGTYTVLATNNATTCTGAMSGSATVVINPLPTAYAVSGGGSYCSGGTGVNVGLGNSAVGINYQLYRGATAVGSPVAGTGSSISFGLQTTAGTYTVLATNATTSCTNGMSGSAVVVVNPLPVAYTVLGGGGYCIGSTGVHVGLGGSEPGVNYQLYNGSTTIGSPVAGLGSGLDFGVIYTAGTYTVRATNATTSCVNGMSGSATVTINSLPTAYTVTGGGGYCADGSGVSIGMATSTSGFSYQLYRGATVVGSAVAGTGAAISFGTFTVAGTYSVLATSAATGCTNAMANSVTVSINALPAAYTITGGGSYCSGGTGVNVGISNSQSGVNYQLYNGASTAGTAVAGTGSAFDFGLQFAAGTYSIIATNASTGCVNTMSGTVAVVVNPVPTAYSVTGGGSYCTGGTGVPVGVSNSALGTSYQLYSGATAIGSPVAGTGSAISFGIITTPGTYTVTATNATTGCANSMFGSAVVTVNSLPAVYTVTGGGSFCVTGTGPSIGLNNSAVGVSYRLYNGASAVGSPVAGTGGAISFGTMSSAGTYTVLATNSTTGCTNAMSGSATVIANAVPTVFTVTGGGGYCTGGTGVAIGLSNSVTGINYQLYNGATAVGGPTAGTGSALNFGLQTTAGTYSVLAINPATSCSSNMTGSAAVVVNALPSAYNVTGGGAYCAGSTGAVVGLEFSATGVNYTLYRGATVVGTFAGTGAALSFGPQSAIGTYTVVATNTTSLCSNNMLGSAVVSVNAAPVAYSITGGGSYCSGGSGVAVGLSNSESAINYQLYNGTTATGAPVAGTGSAISFGVQTATGTYTVRATNATTSCTSAMAGTATISINSLPAAFTVTGGGAYCSGGSGVAVGLSGSAIGVNYRLYSGATAVGTPVAGTGAALDFGFQTTAGSYTVSATSASTTCSTPMSGSATVVINASPVAYTVTGGGSYCAGGTGVHIGLSSSDAGFNYQLYNGATPGVLLAGTGSALDFGLFTALGTYSVIATNATVSSCSAAMSGSVTVATNPSPAVYTVAGGGSYCSGGAGVNIGLSSSDAGISYQLYNGTTATGIVLTGTGSALSFGPLTTTGTYSILATNASTGCTNGMSGTATINVNAVPNVYNVTGGGAICAGAAGVNIGLSNSTPGIEYRLYRGATPIGSVVTGSGSALNFGTFTVAGTYAVLATNGTTGCTSNMSGSAVVNVNVLPTAYTVSGGGTYCSGGAGVTVDINGSQVGVQYQLYNGSIPVTSFIPGTGAPINFGLQTVAGTYSVLAVNTSSGCSNSMSGTVDVAVETLPTVYAVTGGGNYCPGGTGAHIYLGGSAAGVNYKLYNGASLISTVTGTGTILDFGLQTAVGSYSVVASNSISGCSSNMAGSVTVGINPAPTAYLLTGGGTFCTGGTGVSVGLTSSDLDITYELYLDGFTTGASLAGTGSPLDFGLQTTPGAYSIVAMNTLTSCTAGMLDTVTVVMNTLPVTYGVTGGGHYCFGGAGTNVALSGSQTGVNYQLYKGIVPIGAPVSGTGVAIDFGLQTTAGTYSVVATNATTFCVANMAGVATVAIDALPTVYSVSGGGGYCIGGTGVDVLLGGSEAGIEYKLYNGAAHVATFTGTGAAMNLGTYTTAGTYSVVARNITSACTSTMSGTATISVNALPLTYSVTGGGAYCAGGTGVAVGIANSQLGIKYQLYNGSTPVGTPVNGTGAALSFGLQSTVGTYTVSAEDTTTGCTANMAGSAIVTPSPLPAVYTIGSSASSFCAGGTGVSIYLNGSNTGINYQLYNGSTLSGSAIAGTGAAINFGLRAVTGTYVVIATDATTGCTNNMSGSINLTVNPLPTAYTVTGGGGYCPGGAGVNIGLANSNTGVTYQLYKGGTPVGTPVTGTGAAIGFGLQTATGIYSVIATNTSSGCTNNMAGTVAVTINSLPLAYNVTGGGAYCASGTGVHIGLSNSASGTSYQAYNGATAVGSPVVGTGGALDLGLFTAAGTYTVLATSSLTGCTNAMAGSAIITINALPDTQSVTGGGGYCSGAAGVHIGLAGTVTGITYQLYNGGTAVGGFVAGTGSAIDFGVYTTTGTYTVLAINSTTLCTRAMPGGTIVSVNPLPTVFSVIGGGNYCASASGVHVYLSGSSSGVNYQLYNGAATVGLPIPGTGYNIDFGLLPAGVYSVVATNAATSCTRNMSGSATVNVIATVTPSVSITANPGLTVCSGTVTTFTANPVNGGTVPTYMWRVNGTPVGSGGIYSYVPSNGDVISVKLTSNATCALPDTASTSVVMVVNPSFTPSVTVTATPNDTVCSGTMVTFTPTPAYGGTAPVYIWMKNGAGVSVGATYSYIPADGDIISCRMASNFTCRLADTVTSNSTAMKVYVPLVPAVTILANPGTTVAKGTPVTFTAVATNAGTAPTYQWLINGTAVTGATSSVYTDSTLADKDSVTCQVVSNGPCGGLMSFNTITMAITTVGVKDITSAGMDVKVLPNPNKGAFTIKGSIVGNGNEDVTIELTNMLGQVVFRGITITQNGIVNERIQVSNTLPNGMYMLTLRTQTAANVYHVIIEQ
jgi:hypothetical protein